MHLEYLFMHKSAKIFCNATYMPHILAHISPNSAYCSRIFCTKTSRIF